MNLVWNSANRRVAIFPQIFFQNILKTRVWLAEGATKSNLWKIHSDKPTPALNRKISTRLKNIRERSVANTMFKLKEISGNIHRPCRVRRLFRFHQGFFERRVCVLETSYVRTNKDGVNVVHHSHVTDVTMWVYSQVLAQLNNCGGKTISLQWASYDGLVVRTRNLNKKSCSRVLTEVCIKLYVYKLALK